MEEISLPLVPELLGLPPIPGSLTPQQHSFLPATFTEAMPSNPFSLERYF